MCRPHDGEPQARWYQFQKEVEKLLDRGKLFLTVVRNVLQFGDTDSRLVWHVNHQHLLAATMRATHRTERLTDSEC